MLSEKPISRVSNSTNIIHLDWDNGLIYASQSLLNKKSKKNQSLGYK